MAGINIGGGYATFPGIVGTASRLGHGGLATVTAANAAIALGGRPVIAARVSEADPRERHRGLSHHTQTVLELCLGEVLVADGQHTGAYPGRVLRPGGGYLKSFTLDAKPCKRYYINAQFKNRVELDFEPVVDYVDDIAGCVVASSK